MGRFPLVHAFGATLINHALRVTNDAVVVTRAHAFQQFDTGNSRSARAVQNDLNVFDLFARDMQRVQQACRTDNRSAVLVIVEDRNIHLFLQALFDDETFRRLDVFKVDSTKRRAHQLDRFAEFVRIFSIQFDVDRVHIGKAFEQNRLTFHHRLAAQRTQITKAKNRCTVGNDRNKVALVRIIISQFRVLRDFFTRNSHTRRIGQRQIPLGCHGYGRLHLPLAGGRLEVEIKRFFAGQF